MNEEFGTAEPEEATFLPVPREKEARVSLIIRDNYLIDDDAEVVNAMGLAVEECMILYFMMCKWRRSTRYLLDFDLPVLTDRTVVFRTGNTFTTNEWLEKYFQNDLMGGAQVQTTFSSKAVLSTLRAYVEINRLHEQFSVASTILVGVSCSMFADNVEGLAHVVMRRVVRLPRFRSCRGRVPEIVSDMPACLTGGGIREFENVTSNYERYLLACVIYTQTYQTRMFIRVVRYHNEDWPEDIHSTRRELVRPAQQMSLLAAETVRKYVPVTRESAGYTNMPGYSERRGVTGLVLKTRAGQTRQSGYKMVESATEPGNFDIDVQVLGASGVPVMILPVTALGDNNPYALKVKVSHEDFEKSRFRSTAKLVTAWNYAWMAGVSGYDCKISGFACIGPERYYVGNSTQWTHALLRASHEEDPTARIDDIRSRDNPFLRMACVHEYHNRDSVEMKMTIRTRGTQVEGHRGMRSVSEVGGRTSWSMQLPLRSEVGEPRAIRRRVYRTAQGFRFVSPAEAG